MCIQEKKELAKYVYFPQESGQKMQFGEHTIECVSKQDLRFVTRRVFRLPFKKGTRINHSQTQEFDLRSDGVCQINGQNQPKQEEVD